MRDPKPTMISRSEPPVSRTSASYSIIVRCQIENRPGMLGRLASTIGEAGGDIGAIDIVRQERGILTRDVTVSFTAKPASGGTLLEGSVPLKRNEFKIGDGPWADTSVVANEVTIRFRLFLTK